MISKTSTDRINLGKRPDLMLKLEQYGLIPKGNPEGVYSGYGKKLSAEGTAPYDQAVYQAMAERLPDGWEDITLEELRKLIDKVNEKVQQKSEEPLSFESLGDKALLENFLRIALLAITTAAALIDKSKFSWVPEKENSDLKDGEKFTYVLLLQIALESNAVREIFRTIGASTGLNLELQEALMDSMQLLGILLAIKIASMKNFDYGIALVEEFRDALIHGIEKAQAVLQEAEKSEKLSASIPSGVALYLQQGKIALEKSDFEGFYETYKNALGLLEITDEQFTQDLEGVREFAARIVYACTLGRNDQTNTVTGITQA